MRALRRSRPAEAAGDAEIVARVIAGDHDVYGVLVRRHQDLLYRHARGMGIDHDTSLDLVQDAFVKGYTRLEDCRDVAHFRAWLFRICRNLCLDHLRNVRRLSVPLSVVVHAEQIEDTAAGQTELAMTLRAALDQLPDSLREAFLMRHDAGYSYDEIAAVTDASTSAVKMRVHRARETLRSFLSAEDETAA